MELKRILSLSRDNKNETFIYRLAFPANNEFHLKRDTCKSIEVIKMNELVKYVVKYVVAPVTVGGMIALGAVGIANAHPKDDGLESRIGTEQVQQDTTKRKKTVEYSSLKPGQADEKKWRSLEGLVTSTVESSVERMYVNNGLEGVFQFTYDTRKGVTSISKPSMSGSVEEVMRRIINEKYGYPGGDPGRISVTVEEAGGKFNFKTSLEGFEYDKFFTQPQKETVIKYKYLEKPKKQEEKKPKPKKQEVKPIVNKEKKPKGLNLVIGLENYGGRTDLTANLSYNSEIPTKKYLDPESDGPTSKSSITFLKLSTHKNSESGHYYVNDLKFLDLSTSWLKEAVFFDYQSLAKINPRYRNAYFSRMFNVTIGDFKIKNFNDKAVLSFNLSSDLIPRIASLVAMESELFNQSYIFYTPENKYVLKTITKEDLLEQRWLMYPTIEELLKDQNTNFRIIPDSNYHAENEIGTPIINPSNEHMSQYVWEGPWSNGSDEVLQGGYFSASMRLRFTKKSGSPLKYLKLNYTHNRFGNDITIGGGVLEIEKINPETNQPEEKHEIKLGSEWDETILKEEVATETKLTISGATREFTISGAHIGFNGMYTLKYVPTGKLFKHFLGENITPKVELEAHLTKGPIKAYVGYTQTMTRLQSFNIGAEYNLLR